MISEEIKTFILEDWLAGLSYRELNRKYDVALGSLSTLIGEYKTRAPDIEQLRKFKLKLEAEGMNIYDLTRALEITMRLNEIGIGTASVKEFCKIIANTAPETLASKEFVKHILCLRALEEKTQLDPETIICSLEIASKELETRNRELLTVETKIQDLKNLHDVREFMEWMKSSDVSFQDLIDHCVGLEDLAEQRKKAMEKLRHLKREIEIEKRSIKMFNKILRTVLSRTLSPQPQAYWP